MLFKYLRNKLLGPTPVYHFHIRKTGGTSLNKAFLELSGDPDGLYEDLAAAPNLTLTLQGRRYVGWDTRLIRKGRYFYAFSHTPKHELRLPPHICTVTCLRDPAKRVFSHYRMLMEYKVNHVDHPCMETEGPWLGGSFLDFLERIPKEHLLRQVYMFSREFDPDEAYNEIVACSHYMFVEKFADAVTELAVALALPLRPRHSRRTTYDFSPASEELDMLRSALKPEYSLYRRLWLKKYPQEKIALI